MKKLLSTSALCLGIVGAAAVDAHAQNNLFVANIGSNTVTGYNTTSQAMVGSFAGGDALSSIMQPVGLAADATNNLYVTSYNSGTNTSSILRLANAGDITTTVLNSPSQGSALQNPKAIAFGANQNTLYVANGGAGSPVNNSYIGVANVNSGGYSQPNSAGNLGFGGPGPLNGAYALAFDGTRYLYSGGLDNRIVRFDTTITNDPGTLISLVPTVGVNPAPAANISVLNGLAVGPDGALYITDGTRGTILRAANPSSATNSSNLTLITNSFAGQGPEGLAFDPVNNNLLYVSTDDDNIQRLILGGSAVTGFITGAKDPSFLVQEPLGSGPAFLAFSPIPEPSTYALFGVAGAAMLVFGLKRRQQLTLRA